MRSPRTRPRRSHAAQRARASRLALVLACALGCGLVSHGPSTSAFAQDAPAAAGAPKRVVFVLPELDEDADAQLRDALLAQFALVDAELSFAAPRPMGRTQLERLAALHAIATRADALAAFYIEVEPSGRWLLHVFDAERQRMVLRPLDGGGDQRPAAIEAVAVMTRESTRALIEGMPVPTPPEAEVAEPEPPTPPSPPPSPPKKVAAPRKPAEPSWLRPRLSLGYVVTTLGAGLGARHGAAITLGQRFSSGLRAALGIDLTPPLERAATPAFELQCVPVRGLVAGRLAHTESLVLELEGAVTVEWLMRHSLTPSGVMPTSVTPYSDARDIVVALGPRAHGEYRPGGPWALWASLGADILLNPFRYVALEGQLRHELLSLYRVRLLGQIGLAVDL